jgi:hypothetical protein
VKLTPEELGDLAKRMVEENDPTEADRLQEEIVRGFYGRIEGQDVILS